MKEKVAHKINQISDNVLAISGVFSMPQPGTQPAGVSRTGANVFVAKGLINSGDTRSGATLIHALAAFVTPFNVLSKKEKDAIDSLVTNCINPNLYAVLDKLHQNREGEKFAATVIKATGAPVSKILAGTVAFKLYDHWGVISPAQKSLSLAATGIQVHKTNKGGAVCDLKIVTGEETSFSVKDALNMMQQGKNPYPLVQNWEQIYRLVKVYNEKPTSEALMDFAVSHQLIGQGAKDAAVPGVSKKAIEQSGSRPAPQYGVGALAVPKGKQPPDGYTEVANMPQGNVIIPKANGSTAIGAVKGSLLGTKGGTAGISGDAVSTYSKWNKKEAKATDKGAEGGSALIAGLSLLKKSDPYLYSAMVSFIARFCYEKLTTTNPSQYVASLIGIALARIVTGKSEQAADSQGLAIAQQVEASIPADFAKLQIKLRGLYADFGVSSRADAYQLSNQAYSEGRINESDLVAMQEMYDVLYDINGFGALTKLVQGADKGLQIARIDFKFTNTMTDNAPSAIEQVQTEDIRAKNRAKFQAQQAEQSEPEQMEAEESPEGMMEAPPQEVAQNGAV